MALYANFITNPSLELATTGWASVNGGTLSRVGSNAFSGTYSLRIQKTGNQNVFGGAETTVTIPAAASTPYTLSLYISGATENHGASNNAGTKVTVYDILAGQTTREQRATQTFSRTTNGRVAIRNFTPRATADRIVITVETASSYFRSGGFTTTGPFTRDFSAQTYGSTSAAQSAANSFAAGKYNATISSFYGAGGYLTYRVTYYERVAEPDDEGGTATVFVDAVQIEQAATESSYVDGSTPGYVWAGDPHASATLNMVPLQSSGPAALTGPNVETLLLRFLQGGGELTLTGPDVEVKTEGTVSASGNTTTLSGSAVIWSSGAAGSAGAMSMVGSIVMARIVDIEASGSMGQGSGPGEPYAEIRLVWDAGGATGDPMLMDGSVEISFPLPMSGDGSMVLTGTARAEIGYQLTASGTLTLNGTAQLDDAIPQAAFEDFVIYSAASDDSDPLMLGRGGGNAGTASGANGAAWNRIWAEFYAPADMPVSGGGYAWHRAAYAAVGFKFTGVPAGNYQELSCVQLEPSASTSSPGPRAYKTAKTITPMVWADRINYANGPLWTFFGASGISVTNGGTSPIAHDSQPIRNLNFSSTTPSGFFGGNFFTPPKGMWCVASVYLRGDGNIPAMRMRILNGALTTLAATDYVPLPEDEWIRVELPFQATVDDLILVLDPPDDILAVPAKVEAAGVMVEHGTRAGEYLGFIAGTTDYFYRNNGSDPEKGVFLYRNIGERIPLLTDALQAHAQLAVQVAEPEFGLIPTLD